MIEDEEQQQGSEQTEEQEPENGQELGGLQAPDAQTAEPLELTDPIQGDPVDPEMHYAQPEYEDTPIEEQVGIHVSREDGTHLGIFDSLESAFAFITGHMHPQNLQGTVTQIYPNGDQVEHEPPVLEA